MSKAGRAGAVLSVVAFLVAALPSWHAVAGDDEARRFVCTFTDGAVSTYENGAFVSKPAEALSLTLSDIDLEAQSARLSAGAGGGTGQGGTVRIVRAINANHFLEVAAEGFLNLTTVYDKAKGSDLHPAVHSRHLGVIGEPVYGRYTGTCKAG